MPVSSVEPKRVAERLSRLCHRGLGLESFHREAHRILRPALQDDGQNWFSLDPQSLLPTTCRHLVALSAEAKIREMAYEYTRPDFNQIPDMLRGRIAAGLHEATGGHPERSATFRDVLDPEGFGDELRGLLVDRGSCWGATSFVRRRGRPPFESDHADILRSASPYLAEGTRRGLVLAGPAVTGHAEPGVVVLDAHNRVESINEPAKALLDQLRFDGSDAPELVHALANRTRLAVADANAGLARVRAPTASGAWLTLHGSLLDDDGRIAIVIQPARDADLLPLALDAYGLTEREREVAALAARRLPTLEIGRELYLSPWTVKDYLKTIFEKVGVSNRAELVAAVHLRWVGRPRPRGDERLPG